MPFIYARAIAGMLLALATALPLAKAHARGETGEQPLFATHAPLEMTLEFDFEGICRNPEEDVCEALPAVLSYSDDRGDTVRLEVKLRTRGRWRKETGNCDYPLLFVDLDTARTAGTVFANQSTLPFTTHCKHYLKYQTYAMLEYIAYRYYNLLTDTSLQVRLTHTVFRDTGSGYTLTRYGFFSEHFRHVAARLGAEPFKVEVFDPRGADPMDLATLSLFQYMIGNLDWSVIQSHNIALFRREEGGVIPVPYDFDFSGLVNTEYAAPPEFVKAYTVRARLYRGFCWPGLDWDGLFDRFIALEPQAMDLIVSTPGIDRSGLISSRRYLNHFFSILGSPKKRQREIIDRCRELPVVMNED